MSSTDQNFYFALSSDNKENGRQALSYYKNAYLICKPHAVSFVIDKISRAFRTVDMSMARARQFIKYQKYGHRDEYPDDSVISIIEAETRQFYAAFYTSQMLPDLSIMEFEAILDLNNLPEQWYAFAKDYIAHLYLSKQDPEQALYWYNRIIEDHPNLKNWPASAHFSIASCYLRQDEIEKAKKELRTIITEHPESSWANPAKKKLRSLE